MTLDQLLTHFANVRKNGAGYTADCPCHSSQSRKSLSIGQKGDKVLLHCFGNCKTEDVLTKVGLTFADLHINDHSQTSTEFTTTSKTVGKPLGWIADYCCVPASFLDSLPLKAEGASVAFTFPSGVKKLRPAGDKTFAWDPKGAPTPPLWPMPGPAVAETIWLTEGETDCIIARYVGLDAYATTKGAGTPLKPEQVEALKRRGLKKVAICYDIDQAGRDGAEQQAQVLAAAGLEVVNIDLAGAGLVDSLSGQKDLRDAWLGLKDAMRLSQALKEAENLTSNGTYPTCEVRFRPREVDLTELAITEYAQLESFPLLGQDGYIIKKWAHILSGYPKAGKTELLFACVTEWLQEGARVLWLSEESENVWQKRRSRYPDIVRGLRVVFALGAEPETLLERARTGSEDVVILDTIRNLLRIRDENDNAEIAACIGPWEVALPAKTRVYVHHDRKMGGEHGQAIAGGGAFLGVVDRAIELRFDPHEKKRRQLVVHSRIVEAPELLYELTPEGFKALGEPSVVALQEVAETVFETLTEDWQKTKDIHGLLSEPRPSLRQVQQALRLLYDAGRAERDPLEDKPGATYKWRTAQTSPRTASPYSARLGSGESGKAPTPSTENQSDREEFKV